MADAAGPTEAGADALGSTEADGSVPEGAEWLLVEPEEATVHEVRWALFAGRVLRLAFKRRQFSNMGSHLGVIKRRGQR